MLPYVAMRGVACLLSILFAGLGCCACRPVLAAPDIYWLIGYWLILLIYKVGRFACHFVSSLERLGSHLMYLGVDVYTVYTHVIHRCVYFSWRLLSVVGLLALLLAAAMCFLICGPFA